MDQPSLFEIVAGVCGLFGSFILYALWGQLKEHRDVAAEQRKELQVLTTKLNSVEVLVAGQYVRRDELAQEMRRLDQKLDENFRIVFNKLDAKADK